MTDVHKATDSDGVESEAGAHKGSPEMTVGEETAGTKGKLKSDRPGAGDPERRQADDAPPAESPGDSNGESKPFDYGGLPDRNLKKNLGCG